MTDERPGERAIGLRGRLAASIAVILLAALAVTFVAVYRGTGSDLRGGAERLGGDQPDRACPDRARTGGRRLHEPQGEGAGLLLEVVVDSPAQV